MNLKVGSMLCTLYANPSTANNHTICYLAKGGKKVQGQDLDEHEQLIVEQYTIPQLKQLLLDQKIGQALHCAGIFLCADEVGRIIN